MITQEQRQAWKDEYLEQLSNISKEILPVDDKYSLDSNSLDDRLLLFLANVIIPLLNSFGYVMQNFPVVVAKIDGKANKKYSLSIYELFDYLYGMSNYGRDQVLSVIPDYYQLFVAVQENNKEEFVNIIKERGVDVSAICKDVGYTNFVLLLFRDSLSLLIESIISDESSNDEELIERSGSLNKKIRKMLSKEAINFWSIEDKLDSVLNNSQLDIKSLSRPFWLLYTLYCNLWVVICSLAGGYFEDEEVNIVKTLINSPAYNDITNDLKHLAFVIYEVSPERLYHLE